MVVFRYRTKNRSVSALFGAVTNNNILYCSKLNTISFLHNGASAEPTVAHTHLHVVTIPDQYEYLAKIAKDIIKFNRNETDINLDYVNKLRHEFGNILYQHRAMNRSPTTFILNFKNIDNSKDRLKLSSKNRKLIA